jgi:hypothetical protein
MDCAPEEREIGTDGLTKAIETIDRLGIRRDAVQMCVFSARQPPTITLTIKEFRRVFYGRKVIQSPGSPGWERLRIDIDGAEIACVRRVEQTPAETRRMVR